MWILLGLRCVLTSQKTLLLWQSAGIMVFIPGIVGRILQLCCPSKEPPYIIFCEEVGTGNTIPNECWFKLEEVSLDHCHNES